MQSRVTLLACVFAALSVASAKVVELSAMSFPKVIENHKKLIFVEFYAPDCYHCQAMEPVMEDVADELGSQVTVVKVDARSSYQLNSLYKVKKTPTLLLFRNGTMLNSAYDDIQGYRDVATLVPYIKKYLGTDVTEVSSATDIDEIVEEEEFVVVGAFGDEAGEEQEIFEQLAAERRGHVRFASVIGDEASRAVAEAYEVDEVPSVFIVKQRNHTLQFDGDIKSKADVEGFVAHYAFPLVGNFSMLTFYRYTKRDAPQLMMFYNQHEGPDGGQKALEARQMLQELGTEFDDLSIMSVEASASEDGPKKILHMMGLSNYKFPAIAIRTKDGDSSLAYNQLVPITLEGLRTMLAAWEKGSASGAYGKDRCMITKNADREDQYPPELVEAYDEYAQSEKSRIHLGEDEIKEVDMQSYKKVIKRSWKDVLVIYTARWCLHSLHLEDNVHRLYRQGAFDDIADEISIVKVDVVLTEAPDMHNIDAVPGMKYISARYKDFPNWYGGSPYDPDAIVQFVRAYHSMRHVEIPGEGSSPFARKKEEDPFEGLEKEQLAGEKGNGADDETFTINPRMDGEL